MEINEVVTNSEVVEKMVEEAAEAAVETMAKANNGSIPNVAVGFGAGVLAGVIVCKYVLPWVERKIRRKKVYVTPVVVAEEEPPQKTEDEATNTPVEASDADSGKENPEK